MVAINLLIMVLNIWGCKLEQVLAKPKVFSSIPEDIPAGLSEQVPDESILCNCKKSKDGTLVLACTTEDVYKLNVLKQRDIQTLISNARKDKSATAISLIGSRKEPYVAAFQKSGFKVVARSGDGNYVALRKYLE